MKSPYTDLTPEESRVLKKVAAKGRMGDTELAHITKEEAAMLKRMGGSGTINPYTGQKEYFLGKALGSFMEAVFAAPEFLVDLATGEQNAFGQFVENITFGAIDSEHFGTDPVKYQNPDGTLSTEPQDQTPGATQMQPGYGFNLLGQTVGLADPDTPGGSVAIMPSQTVGGKPLEDMYGVRSPERLPSRRGLAGDATNMPTAANQPVNLFEMVMRADSGTKEQEDEDEAFAVLPFISGSARYGAKMKRMQNRPFSYSRGGKYGND
jgi:hypothetical protein